MRKQRITCGMLFLLALFSISASAKPKLSGTIATNSAPLHSESIQVGDRVAQVGFFMWPIRTNQLALLSVQGALNPKLTVLRMVPAPNTNAVSARSDSAADAVLEDVSWHEFQVPVQGAWHLEVTDGGDVGRIPVQVAGPPVIPTWLGWLIATSPLVGLAYFLRKLRHSVRIEVGSSWWDETNSSSPAGPYRGR